LKDEKRGEESYGDATCLVVKHIYKHGAAHSQRTSSEKSCEKSIDQNALEIFGNSNSEMENGSPEGSNDKRQPPTLDFGKWAP
jgi:hypothetical protein